MKYVLHPDGSITTSQRSLGTAPDRGTSEVVINDMPAPEPGVMFRCYEQSSGFDNGASVYHIAFYRYLIEKQTAKTATVVDHIDFRTRTILLTADKGTKRWAYLDPALALHSLMQRRLWQLSYARQLMDRCNALTVVIDHHMAGLCLEGDADAAA